MKMMTKHWVTSIDILIAFSNNVLKIILAFKCRNCDSLIEFNYIIVTQSFSRVECAILALNIAPVNPEAFLPKDIHKSRVLKQSAGDDVENIDIDF